MAVNKGEIVKRILYSHPDAEFIFCAGDDKTDEDMFRALLLFPQDRSPSSPSTGGGGAMAAPSAHVTLDPPLSVTLLASSKEEADKYVPVDLALERDAVFTTAVGHSSKRTLAVWHVTTSEEVVEHMLYLVRFANDEAAAAAAASSSNSSSL